MNDLTDRLVRNVVRAQSDTMIAERIAALENFVVEVRDCVPDLFGADHDLIDVAVIEAFQADALALMPLDAPSDLIEQSPQVQALVEALTAIADVSSISGKDFKIRHPQLNAKLDEVGYENWAPALSYFAYDALAAIPKGGK